MSITPYTVGPAVVVCAGAVLFFLGWRELGLVLMLAPIVLGLLLTLWYLLRSGDD